jgi:hypothetical protein
MPLFKLPLLLSLSSLALSAAVPAPPVPAITAAPAPIADPINKREAWPDSISSLIPQKIDTRYFSIDGDGNTQAKVSDHFSTVSVTVSKRAEVAVHAATAAVGIYSEKVASGATEFSFEVAPDVIEKIKAAIKKLLADQEAGLFEIFDLKLKPAAEAAAEVINAEAGPSLIGVEMGGEGLAVVAAEGALPAGAAGAVALGAEVVPYVAFVSWMSWTWAKMVVALNSSPQLKLPHSVVIDVDKIPTQQECQGPNQKCKADTCKGQLSICSVGPHCKSHRIYSRIYSNRCCEAHAMTRMINAATMTFPNVQSVMKLMENVPLGTNLVANVPILRTKYIQKSGSRTAQTTTAS